MANNTPLILSATGFGSGLTLSATGWYGGAAPTASSPSSVKNIYIGSNQVLSLYVGSVQVQAVYLGNTLVWEL